MQLAYFYSKKGVFWTESAKLRYFLLSPNPPMLKKKEETVAPTRLNLVGAPLLRLTKDRKRTKYSLYFTLRGGGLWQAGSVEILTHKNACTVKRKRTNCPLSSCARAFLHMNTWACTHKHQAPRRTQHLHKHQAPRHNKQNGAIALTQFLFL